MSVPVVAFFNNKGGVGKTSLVYHLAWMYVELGFRVVAADLDPQANLTAAFLTDERLQQIWLETKGSIHQAQTIFECIQPLLEGTGDIAHPNLELIDDNLALLVGDLALSGFEDELSQVWSKCLDGSARAFRVTSAFWRTMQQLAAVHRADIILVDIGPNLGAINRAALISADYIVVPLSPDLFSLQGLRNLGPTLRRWREEWKERLKKQPIVDLDLPTGRMEPAGYIVLQHAVRFDRPVKAYEHWIAKIPSIYRSAVLDQPGESEITLVDDPYRLALLKNYQSLMPMAQEAHKPIFALKPADGAIGAHTKAVKKVYEDFSALAHQIENRIQLVKSDPMFASQRLS